MDEVFSMMDSDPDMGPKLRDADVPQRFEFPDLDLVVNIRAAQGTSFYEMASAGKQVADVVRKNPYIDSFMVRTGGQGGYDDDYDR